MSIELLANPWIEPVTGLGLSNSPGSVSCFSLGKVLDSFWSDSECIASQNALPGIRDQVIDL